MNCLHRYILVAFILYVDKAYVYIITSNISRIYNNYNYRTYDIIVIYLTNKKYIHNVICKDNLDITFFPSFVYCFIFLFFNFFLTL